MVTYRSDIDGLRALAVLLVLMFHGGITLFPSGFIGVDIFFVISGFLITSIITSDLQNGTFSLPSFYIKRLWRIQPALLSVVLFSFIIAIIFYLPSDLINFIKSAKYTNLAISNQFFARSTTSYAAPDTHFLLLLHTWSLSIEWQWYLLLPITVVLQYRYLKTKWIATTNLVLLIVSISLCYYLSLKFPDKSYYFLTSRMFEFMLGACLVTLKNKAIKLGCYTASLAGLLSLIAIAYCSTKANILPGYPDYHGLIVSISTVLLIVTGSTGNSAVSRVLSLQPLPFIGAISYSLYLWHWPVFAAARYLGYIEDVNFKVACYVITLFLSCLSYFLIEKPLRKVRFPLSKSLFLLILVPLFIFLTLLPVTLKYSGFPFRFSSEFSRVESLLAAYNSSDRERCLDGNSDGIDNKCLIGEINAKKRALLIGDSHSNHFWKFFDTLAKNAHMSVMVQGTSSCLTLPEIYQFDWWHFKNRVYKACHDNTEKYYINIKKSQFDYVIIGEVWMNYAGSNIINHLGDKRSIELSRNRIEIAMRKSLDIIVKSGAKPVIIKTIMPMPHNFMNCFYQHFKLRRTFSSAMCSGKNPVDDENQWFSQLFIKMKKEYPSLIVIDPKDVQCERGLCKSDIEGIPVYRDVGHLTDYSSLKFGEAYLRKFKNPFL